MLQGWCAADILMHKRDLTLRGNALRERKVSHFGLVFLHCLRSTLLFFILGLSRFHI